MTDRLAYDAIRDGYLKVADDKAPIRELIAAADARIDYAEARTKLAARLLERVVIKGGCGSWTDEERDAWASSYKDFLIDATGGFFPVVTLRLSDVRALLRLAKAVMDLRPPIDQSRMGTRLDVDMRAVPEFEAALAALEAPCDTETP